MNRKVCSAEFPEKFSICGKYLPETNDSGLCENHSEYLRRPHLNNVCFHENEDGVCGSFPICILHLNKDDEKSPIKEHISQINTTDTVFPLKKRLSSGGIKKPTKMRDRKNEKFISKDEHLEYVKKNIEIKRNMIKNLQQQQNYYARKFLVDRIYRDALNDIQTKISKLRSYRTVTAVIKQSIDMANQFVDKKHIEMTARIDHINDLQKDLESDEAMIVSFEKD